MNNQRIILAFTRKHIRLSTDNIVMETMMIKLSYIKMKCCYFDGSMVNNRSTLERVKFTPRGDNKHDILSASPSSEQMMKGQWSKRQLRYLFTVEIGPSSTCLIPNVSVSLHHRHCTTVWKLTLLLGKHLSNNKLNPQMVWSQESNPGCIMGEAKYC